MGGVFLSSCAHAFTSTFSFSIVFISLIESLVFVLDGRKHPKHIFGCRLCKEEERKAHFLKDDLYGRNLVKHLSLKHGCERESREEKHVILSR